MNLKENIIRWPKHFRPIPAPFYVVTCGDHCMVCMLTDEGDLIGEVSAIHWNRYIVRTWALNFAMNAELNKQMED